MYRLSDMTTPFFVLGLIFLNPDQVGAEIVDA
jgi:hypothetical protein